MTAVKELDALLTEDQTSGALLGDKGSVVIPFLGITKPRPITYGPFRERGSLDGEVVRVGGVDRRIPVTLKNGKLTYYCSATKELAKRISKHLFEGYVRVYGTGKWRRHADGRWEMDEFLIDDFEHLDESRISVVRDRLANEGPTGWAELEDPIGDALRIRKDSGAD
jgi:hypothetical protein